MIELFLIITIYVLMNIQVLFHIKIKKALPAIAIFWKGLFKINLYMIILFATKENPHRRN